MNEVKGETPSTLTVSDDPLQPPVCTGCGYELIGLAPDCICPECGVQRDPRAIVLRGFATGVRKWTLTERAGNNRKWWNWASGGLVALALFFLVLRPVGISSYFMIVWLFHSLVLFVMGVYAYHRQKNEGHLPVNVIIHPDGVCQRSKYGKQFTLTKLNYEQAVEFDETPDGFRTLKITQQDMTTFYANMAKYQPVAIEFKASGETVARVRAMLNGEKL